MIVLDLDLGNDIYQDIIFHGFQERRESLRKIKRYRGMPVVFYRNNLADHALKVACMVMELLPYAQKAFPNDFDHQGQLRALAQALVHDDAETVMKAKDIPLFDKLNASPGQLQEWEQDEQEAIKILAAKSPKMFLGFVYEELLRSSMDKHDLCGKLVSYGDKLEGMGECNLEIYAGNTSFVEHNKHKPLQQYIEIFRDKENWLPWKGLEPLFRYDHPFLDKPELLDVPEIANRPDSKPYADEKSIRKPTGNKFYDKYKEVILERGGQRRLELLITQREFSSTP